MQQFVNSICVAAMVLVAGFHTQSSAFAQGAPPQTPNAPPQPVLGKPPIEFHPDVLDMGTVRPNQLAIGSVQLHNVSEKWLKVLATKADCSCTSINLADTMLAPGQSIPLEAHLNRNVMGEWSGVITVWIEGYDPVALPARAIIALPVRANPAHITSLRDAQGNHELSGQYDVTAIDGKTFRVLSVNGEPPMFVDFDPAKDEPRSAYRLSWDFSGYDSRTCLNDKGKRLPVSIVVETDHPECPIFDLEVRHECNRYRFQPNDTWAIQEKRVFVGALQDASAIEVELVAKWLPRRPNRQPIKSIVSESSQFTAELLNVETLEDGMRCKVRIKPAAGHRGYLHGTIRVHSAGQSAAVPVVGTVR